MPFRADLEIKVTDMAQVEWNSTVRATLSREGGGGFVSSEDMKDRGEGGKERGVVGTIGVCEPAVERARTRGENFQIT